LREGWIQKLEIAEEKDFRRGELPGKYMSKMLYRWNDSKFENEYLKKLKRNWQKWKLFSLKKNPWGRVMSELKMVDFNYSIFFSIESLKK